MNVRHAERPASMLVRFEASNARSFRDPFELNLMSTALSEKAFVRDVPWRDGGQPLGLLPAACIFGANGSGKSNVLKAMADMRSMVLNSFAKWAPSGGTVRHPFRLDETSASQPSRYELDVVLGGVRHEYGFELDDYEIRSEWAYRYPKGRPALMFRREAGKLDIGASLGPKGRAAVDLLRPNALFLSTAAAAGQPELAELFSWFGRNFLLADAESRHFRHLYTADLIARGERQTEQVLSLLRAADLGVVGVRRQEMDPAMLERVRRVFRAINEEMGSSDDGPLPEITGLTLSHHGAHGSYDLASEEESLGTMVWLGLAGPVVAALEQGSVFLADEIDASLHPSLVSQLVRMFQNPQTNPNRAQIVFNSHEVTLLGDSGSDLQLGRDQVWFTEKIHDGGSRLYPLSALDPRKDEAVGRRYLAGRYGGLPIVASGDFEAAAELITSGAER